MHPSGKLWVVLVNLVALVIAIVATWHEGQPRVLLYALGFDYLLRLLTITAFARASDNDGRMAWLRPAIGRMSTLPAPGQQSQPMSSESAGPLKTGGYVFVMLVLFLFAFVLTNVNASRRLDLEFPELVREVIWGLGIGSAFWIEGLVARSIVFDPAASLETNLGFNTRDVTILALAILTGAWVVVFRQSQGYGPSGWVVFGPVLAYRFAFDLAIDLRLARRRRESVGART